MAVFLSRYKQLCILPLLTGLMLFVVILYSSIYNMKHLMPWSNSHNSAITSKPLWESRKDGKRLLVWPEEDSSDRILAQLKITTPADAKVKTIYFSRADFVVPYGNEFFLKNNCNVKKCLFTSDRANADAILFKHLVLEDRINVSSNQIWILYSLESPYHQGFVTHAGVVNWTATYRRDSDIVAPYGKWVYFDNNVRMNRNVTTNYAAGKTKKVVWFVSNCHARNNRLEYAKELAKYIEVDIYGKCGTMKCDRPNEECFNMLKTQYKFYLAFENSNCRDYITEKFYRNALLNDILPVVMGAHPKDYAPENSYIHVDSFSSPEDLATYLHLLDKNDDLYNYYFSWKGTGDFINPKFFCRLCAMLHTPRAPKFYPNFKEWWNGDGICYSRSLVDIVSSLI